MSITPSEKACLSVSRRRPCPNERGDPLVAEMCEEYESLHDRSGRLDKVMGRSIVLSVIKTEVPLDSDGPAYINLLFATI